jgi:hypothetical protein
LGTFLAVISLCLNLVGFYWILILFQRLNTLKGAETTSDPEALQEQLDEHIERIRQENAQFLFEFESRMNKASSAPPLRSFDEVLRGEDLQLQETSGQPVKEAERVTAPSGDRLPDAPSFEISVDVLETSLTAQILLLKEQGLSVDKIAKKLKMGKGEVALMLKLHEKR